MVKRGTVVFDMVSMSEDPQSFEIVAIRAVSKFSECEGEIVNPSGVLGSAGRIRVTSSGEGVGKGSSS